MKLKVGSKVRVAKNAPVDANVVAGRLGKVVAVDGPDSFLVRFSRWAMGHGNGRHEWYINPIYLHRVRVQRKANRA